MRSKNTFSVLFWIDQKRATNNEALIYARVTINQKRVNISLKQKVSLRLWDTKMKKAKGSSIGARQINQYLASLLARYWRSPITMIKSFPDLGPNWAVRPHVW